MIEHDNEPIRGLPGMLPPGEVIVWQGAPQARLLALTAFRIPWVAGYFGLLALWALADLVARGGSATGLILTGSLGAGCIGLLSVLAWASARTTVYTLTNRRLVLRIGIAVPKCINLPLGVIGAIDLAEHGAGGDVALRLNGPARLGILALWPHARPFHITTPQPTLRAIADAPAIAALIAQHCRATAPMAQAMSQPQREPASAVARNPEAIHA